MIDCPKFVEMQKMLHAKSMVVAKVQPIAETQIVTTYVNVVDVNVTTRSKVTKEQVFKDREPRKANSVVKWEKKEQLKKLMVEIIQYIQKTQTQIERPSTSMEGWNITQLGMPNTIPMEAQKNQKIMKSQEKLITIEESFLNISKQMLKTSYILSLGQLLELTLELKRYFWQKLKLEKTQNLSRTTTKKQVGSLVPKVGIVVIAINNHMAVIQV